MVRESKNKQIERLITPRLTAEHIELLEVEYRKENGEQILRLFIDSEKGVDLNVCSRATRAVKDIIDENSIDYDHLEVSSPGINRILKNDSHLVKHNQAGYRLKQSDR
jgi:ribosome maturation factor RimP